MAYKPGENWIQCDRCGFKLYASESKRTWDGWVVCSECYEDKHPALIPHPLSGDRERAKIVRTPKEYFIEPPEETEP